jgi:hypothetical protein
MTLAKKKIEGDGYLSLLERTEMGHLHRQQRSHSKGFQVLRFGGRGKTACFPVFKILGATLDRKPNN